MSLPLDEWIEITSKCQYLPELDLKRLCDYVSGILIEEPNIINVSSPVTICGDVHGQFHDVEELFRTGGPLPMTKYIFMGDFVDRGYYSLETWTRLLVFKARWPDRIVLLRGNHESRQITQSYGFYDECNLKYGGGNSWKICCQVFDLLAIAALIDDSVLCIHGGLSPFIKTLDKIRIIRRNMEIPNRGGFSDLVWSDPDDVNGWELSPRGAGWLFGASITREFSHLNGLSLICRAHQLVNEGYKFMFNDQLVTVWSAPNYCYRCGNVASVLQFDTASQYKPLVFAAVSEAERSSPDRMIVPYFL